MQNANTHRVVSYNLLTPPYAKPDQFFKQDPADLDAETRYKKIIQQFDDEIEYHGDVIFTLQEVSETWSLRLYKYFLDKKYLFVCKNYGSKWSDYMGVALAIPLEKYLVEEVVMKRIGDLVVMPKQPKSSYFGKALEIVLGYSFDLIRPVTGLLNWLLGTKFGIKKKVYDIYSDAKERYNYTVACKLKDKEDNKCFWVATYHMPCNFKEPQMMNIHVGGLFNFLQNKATERVEGDNATNSEGSGATSVSVSVPLIVAGDFNLQPDSSSYEMITTGQLSENHPEFPKTPSYDPAFKFQTFPLYGMTSAYKSCLKVDPDFTNNAWVMFDGEENKFVGCIDYIFHSKGFVVSDVKHLKSKSDADVSCGPNKLEPSDHILIAATLALEI